MYLYVLWVRGNWALGCKQRWVYVGVDVGRVRCCDRSRAVRPLGAADLTMDHDCGACVRNDTAITHTPFSLTTTTLQSHIYTHTHTLSPLHTPTHTYPVEFPRYFKEFTASVGVPVFGVARDGAWVCMCVCVCVCVCAWMDGWMNG